MSIATLQNDTARLFSIGIFNTRDAIGGVVSSSTFRETVPVRVYKFKQGGSTAPLAGEDGILREFRLVFQAGVTINQSDFIYVQGILYDECVVYEPGNSGLDHHVEVNARSISVRSA